MKRVVLSLRALVFYAGYALLTAWFGITGIVVFRWLPFPTRSRYILGWNRMTIAWLRLTCAVDYTIQGLEYIPDGPVVVLSKHNSQWETFYLQLLFQPLATIMKKEILNIPGFGWGIRLLRPIAIDQIGRAHV